MSRRLAPVAAVLVALALTSACEQAKSLGDKASACAEALGLATLVPSPDPEKTKQEAAAKAAKLQQLAADTQDGNVKGALGALAGEYVEISKKNLSELENAANWAAGLARTQESVRKICL
ncbi:hypothetical protein JOF56_005916 [Kibdelosporangium banguiense]|uniref:Uncharacterized protein n=1 Tax=Kibdelosporangium banguiense TaxID=1365924 RepID=A0ABS4TM96_9PSEU|nr:hypothetical protein [Kibdelosporangium banguiense]MBP2325531.1 hypothetical protein [Kibdelosporangium banguiense]